MHRISEKNALGIEKAIEAYGDMLFRVCLVMLINETDAEDAVQDTFLKYIQKAPEFANSEHEKAWLLKVASNNCKNMLRTRKRESHLYVDNLNDATYDIEIDSVAEILMEIPEKFRLVLSLYYIENYRVNEIAQIIGKTPSAVKMRLQKGRKLFDEKYRKEFG